MARYDDVKMDRDVSNISISINNRLFLQLLMAGQLGGSGEERQRGD